MHLFKRDINLYLHMSVPMKIIAKPFLKWAGGKTQLLVEIENKLPKDFSNKRVHILLSHLLVENY